LTIKASAAWEIFSHQEERSMTKDKDFSVQLMVYTFFFAVAFYLLLIGFHYWHRHTKEFE